MRRLKRICAHHCSGGRRHCRCRPCLPADWLVRPWARRLPIKASSSNPVRAISQANPKRSGHPASVISGSVSGCLTNGNLVGATTNGQRCQCQQRVVHGDTGLRRGRLPTADARWLDIWGAHQWRGAFTNLFPRRGARRRMPSTAAESGACGIHPAVPMRSSRQRGAVCNGSANFI